MKNKIIFIVLLYALNIISSAKDVPADQFSKANLEKLLLSLNQACIESLGVKKPIQIFEFNKDLLDAITTDYKKAFVEEALLGLKDLLDERFVCRFSLEMGIGEQVEEKPKPQIAKKKPANKPLLPVINSHLRRHP